MQNHVVTTVTMICLCILLTTTCLHGDTTATTGDSMTTVTGIDNMVDPICRQRTLPVLRWIPFRDSPWVKVCAPASPAHTALPFIDYSTTLLGG
jgi:hypothetical protein